MEDELNGHHEVGTLSLIACQGEQEGPMGRRVGSPDKMPAAEPISQTPVSRLRHHWIPP